MGVDRAWASEARPSILTHTSSTPCFATAMSGFLQYPEADLEDARKDNVIVFSLIATITLILVSLLLTTLGCIFFSFRSTNG